jgi:hypothetical protein
MSAQKPLVICIFHGVFNGYLTFPLTEGKGVATASHHQALPAAMVLAQAHAQSKTFFKERVFKKRPVQAGWLRVSYLSVAVTKKPVRTT